MWNLSYGIIHKLSVILSGKESQRLYVMVINLNSEHGKILLICRFCFRSVNFINFLAKNSLILLDRGYFIYYKEENIPQHIRAYNIKRFAVSKGKEHGDAALVKEFWGDLERFVCKPRFKSESK